MTPQPQTTDEIDQIINAEIPPGSVDADDRGYTHYRQRSSDDHYIVPHNRHLLLLCDSRINVEVACTVNLIMYLYKYIFKGPDRAQFQVDDTN